MARPRIDATVTSQQQQAVEQIALETGLSSSAVVGEAIGLFMKVFMEAKRGHRLVTLDPISQRPICELITPTLSSMEWARHVEIVQAAPTVIQAIEDMIDEPAAPTEALRDLMGPKR